MSRRNIKPDHFSNVAKYYDRLYTWKDYQKETDRLRQIIETYKKSRGAAMLELACGTGAHAQFLRRHYEIVATDSSASMLRIARHKLKGTGVIFKQLDMTDFRLSKRFDLIVCLFGSIGYVTSVSKLRSTFINLSAHLNPGGIILIDPWFQKAAPELRKPWMSTYSDRLTKIARVAIPRVTGDRSHLTFHYLVAERQHVIYLTSKHTLRLFSTTDLLEAMKASGLKTSWLARGIRPKHGVLIGAKPIAQVENGDSAQARG